MINPGRIDNKTLFPRGSAVGLCSCQCLVSSPAHKSTKNRTATAVVSLSESERGESPDTKAGAEARKESQVRRDRKLDKVLFPTSGSVADKSSRFKLRTS